jgi:preprotein translocase subunit SecG
MLDLLHTPLTVLHVFVCLMLMLVVLIQPGKSGGLGAALGGAGAQQIFGGRGAGNFLTRTTWIAASVFFVTSVTLAYLSTSTGDSLEDLAKSRRKNVPAVPAETAPAAPAAPADPAPAAPAADAPAAPSDVPATGTPASAPGGEPAPAAPASKP